MRGPKCLPPARNFLPPPTSEGRGEGSDFFLLSISLLTSGGRKTNESPLADWNILFYLLDWGSNVHMTPHLDGLSKRRAINTQRTFGNKLHQQATLSGVIKLTVHEKNKAVEVRIKGHPVGARTAMPSTKHRIHEATRGRVHRLRHPEESNHRRERWTEDRAG